MVDVSVVGDVSAPEFEAGSRQPKQLDVTGGDLSSRPADGQGKTTVGTHLDIDPKNPQTLRLAIQVAGVLKERLFADRVLALMEAHNPAALPLARDFINNAFAF